MEKKITEISSVLKENFNREVNRVVLSNPVNKAGQYKKIVLRKYNKKYQLEKYTQTQVFHESITFEEIIPYISNELQNSFKQYNAWDNNKEYIINMTKKGSIILKSKKLQEEKKEAAGHNREKNYIFKEGEKIEPLIRMGVMTTNGNIIGSMYNKYKQINRFVEIIDDEVKKLDKAKLLNIIDFGCGKSYLTFVLYYYFVNVAKIPVNMVGLDLKADVVANCNKIAEENDYENLAFKVGDIGEYTSKNPVNIVITLHACDTATDYALFNAIKWNANLIFSVPCCQHELNEQIKSERFSILTKYGIVKERTAALMTDAIRGSLLEYCGYKTQLLEFVSLDNTPKNIMIRAKKTQQNEQTKRQVIDEVTTLMKEFRLSPKLYELMEAEKYFN